VINLLIWQLLTRHTELITLQNLQGQSMKKICIVLCLCLAALLVLPGCAGEKQLTRVRLSEVTHSVFYAPQYVAMSQGFFRQEGLEVELTNGGGADKGMTRRTWAWPGRRPPSM
jgi:hypothetical protein